MRSPAPLLYAPLAIALAAGAAQSPALAQRRPPAPSPEIALEAQVAKVEMHRLRLENRAGGTVAVSTDAGDTWRSVGSVISPAIKVNQKGYTASKWAPHGAVAATAVNGIHLKVRQSPEGRGVIFSIVPSEGGDLPAGASRPEAAAVTDLAGGTAIFGIWAPYVGNRVYLERGGEPVPLPPDYSPAVGDVLVIVVARPAVVPYDIVFENRFGGLIYIRYLLDQLGPQVPVGQVLRPVLGIGRFEGSRYADVGRVRANHCGVIDISTSPYGQVGGFQIVPRDHAQSPETQYVRTGTQWMVVGPLNALDPSWEGIPPLFSSFIAPAFRPNDLDFPGRATDRLAWMRVEVKQGGRAWQRMPALSVDPWAALPPWATTALSSVTAIRLRFPIHLADLVATPGDGGEGRTDSTERE
ncbi:MAG: hypothetical protein ACE5R4_04535 [Armatimonadota bacterium]